MSWSRKRSISIVSNGMMLQESPVHHNSQESTTWTANSCWFTGVGQWNQRGWLRYLWTEVWSNKANLKMKKLFHGCNSSSPTLRPWHHWKCLSNMGHHWRIIVEKKREEITLDYSRLCNYYHQHDHISLAGYIPSKHWYSLGGGGAVQDYITEFRKMMPRNKTPAIRRSISFRKISLALQTENGLRGLRTELFF